MFFTATNNVVDGITSESNGHTEENGAIQNGVANDNNKIDKSKQIDKINHEIIRLIGQHLTSIGLE